MTGKLKRWPPVLECWITSRCDILLKIIPPERWKGEEDQVADNIHSSATSGTDISDAAALLGVRKRARFVLCAKYMYAYTLAL